jgi:hypothetical protein
MTQLLKTTILMENKNFGGGIGSEKWYFPYSSDTFSKALMNQLGQKRANLMGLGGLVREVRGEVVDVAPNGAPVRNHTIPSQGLLTGGWAWNAPSVDGSFAVGAQALIGSRNAGPTVALMYPGSQGGTRYETLAFAPRGAYGDFGGSSKATPANFTGETQPTTYYTAVRNYYAYLVSQGALVIVRDPNPANKDGITAVTSGNPITPVLATVSVLTDKTGTYPVASKVIVSQRRAQRGLGQSRYKELNGVHSVMFSTYNATTNQTVISLTCTLNTTVDLCRSAGFIRPAKFITNNLLGLDDVYSQVRGRRSRKNVVQV